jgi:uncharacterized protein YfdQ (DUF2303 family)
MNPTMTTTPEPTPRNIAETLADVLPKAAVVHQLSAVAPGLHILHVAVPKATDVREFRIDLEALLPNPRRTKATAQFSDAASFLAYVNRHAAGNTAAWCEFDSQSYALKFTAVIDEHAKGTAGWRAHTATFQPDMSAEWKAWKGKNGVAMPQVTFAEWLQEHEDDITSTSASMPTSLQMHAMCTDFVAHEEHVLKSSVRMQSGGVRLTYVADADTGTTETMQMFEKFGLGIPVFHGGTAWACTARLKYRTPGGKLSFFYELVRPDRVHEGAARELVEQIRAGLGEVPMFMGACG